MQSSNKVTDGSESKSIKSQISKYYEDFFYKGSKNVTDGSVLKSMTYQNGKDDEDKSQTVTDNKTLSVWSDDTAATMKTSQSKKKNRKDVKTRASATSGRSAVTDNNKSVSRRTTMDVISKSKKKDKSSVISDKSFKGLSSTTIMISVVSLVYVLSYLPITVMATQDTATIYQKFSSQIVKYLLEPVKNMYYLGCAANPIIYTFVNHSFRAKCRSLLRL